MKTKKPLSEVLFEIRYPANVGTAAKDWNCSEDVAGLYIKRAFNWGFLVESKEGLCPTEKLLDIWQALGLVKKLGCRS